MSNGFDILADRLAKGEISLEEFEKLKAALTDSNVIAPGRRTPSIAWIAILGLVVAGGAAAMLLNSQSSKVSSTVAAQRATGDLIVDSWEKTSIGVGKAYIVNSSDAAGLIIVSVTDRPGLTTYCEKSFEIQAAAVAKLNVGCMVNPPDPRMKVSVRWAE